jgi:hypothetical protein
MHNKKVLFKRLVYLIAREITFKAQISIKYRILSPQIVSWDSYGLKTARKKNNFPSENDEKL